MNSDLRTQTSYSRLREPIAGTRGNPSLIAHPFVPLRQEYVHVPGYDLLHDGVGDTSVLPGTVGMRPKKLGFRYRAGNETHGLYRY